jgi:hypothetical protein
MSMDSPVTFVPLTEGRLKMCLCWNCLQGQQHLPEMLLDFSSKGELFMGLKKEEWDLDPWV